MYFVKKKEKKKKKEGKDRMGPPLLSISNDMKLAAIHHTLRRREFRGESSIVVYSPEVRARAFNLFSTSVHRYTLAKKLRSRSIGGVNVA